MNTKYLYLILISVCIIGCKNQVSKNSETVIKTETKEFKTDTATLKTTAQPNVKVLEKQFEIANLDRNRQIRIYVPPNYNTSDKKYPVLYMHDAQNLFDKFTSYSSEWGVDESLNELAETSGLELIVVGIDNGAEKRMNELSPWKNSEFGEAEGEAYMKFIVNQIKPYIDNNYRTLADKSNTAIMGSSMGGLISHYAIYQYPEIFSKTGIFSPSYWYSEEVFTFTRNHQISKETKIFLLIGKKEGHGMVENTEKMYTQILSSNHPKENIHLIVDPEGEHNEAFWKGHFTSAIEWLFTNKE
ncbi:alpha/beta hydrolase-fold protein [uncultured Aquimarina sp.]|uniref:alpha/beta hydrolase n=1 Tax=uncultured Aquimarina sp. TaxID=575652 RepID=UPI0026060637|nr:alpha/beta hydrolase-fold protein [uncultured Aquimarina sp.]